MEEVRETTGDPKPMKLIANWHKCWKMSSVQIAALLAALNGAYLAWPAMGAFMDQKEFAILNVVLAALVPAARIVLQPQLKEPTDT